MPCAIAPACPLVPPPATLMLMSNLRCVLVTRRGASATSSRTRRPRNASGAFSLTVTRPSPGCRRTRATAFLRRPVPRLNVSAKVDVSLRVERDLLRLLGSLFVRVTRVDPKPREHIRSQSVVLQHALDGVGDREGRIELLRLLERPAPKATRVAAVVRVLLVLQLRARDLYA